jgi:hypothetical protein
MLASAIVVLATYALLVEVWRRILDVWGEKIQFGEAVRIWCVSNLGRYIPGKVWQIGVMAKLAERVKVKPVAAAGSAILNTVVNIAIGLAVAVVAGMRGLDQATRGHATLSIALTALAIAGVLLIPIILPRLAEPAARLTGRRFEVGPIPPRAVAIAIIGNIAAWVMYGLAFQLLVRGILGETRGSLSDYVAAYALSYVIGYLAFFVPGGLGPREGMLLLTLGALNLATPPEAVVISIVSRLWLTALEVIPGLIYLAGSTRTRTSRHGSNP